MSTGQNNVASYVCVQPGRVEVLGSSQAAWGPGARWAGNWPRAPVTSRNQSRCRLEDSVHCTFGIDLAHNAMLATEGNDSFCGIVISLQLLPDGLLIIVHTATRLSL